MKDSVIFGDKNLFAIEIAPAKTKRKYYLRYWFKSLWMGYFTKAYDLDYSIEQFINFLEKKEKMNLSKFDTMDIKQVWDYVNVIDMKKAEDFDRYSNLEKRGIYVNLGNQLSNTSSNRIAFYKEGVFHFIWLEEFGKPIQEVFVDWNEMKKVYESYLKYCIDNEALSNSTLNRLRKYFPEYLL